MPVNILLAPARLLLGVGFSVFGTVAYLTLYFWWIDRVTRQAIPAGAGGIGWDITSIAHNTYLAPAYWLFVVGLFATGCAIVFLWPGPVAPPPQ